MNQITWLLLLVSFLVSFLPQTHASEPQSRQVKEWTLLTYVSAVNNLSSYSGFNINQMESIGSTEQINIVVQWARESDATARRMLIHRDKDPSRVTSPVLEEFHTPDMGDWRTFVEFIRWGVEKFPAKRYFINIWSHGSGWHEPPMPDPYSGTFEPFDISPDDRTGQSISTRELGMAMTEAERIIGHKVDIYASDACLMSMVEIATEMADSVTVFAGSQATEPGDGWPYTDFLSRWVARPEADPAEVANMLTDSYIAAYSGGRKEATFSALDLRELGPLLSSLSELGLAIQTATAPERASIFRAVQQTIKFSEPDYRDLGDFLVQLGPFQIPSVPRTLLAKVRNHLDSLVITNRTTPGYRRASGLSIWFPDHDRFEQYSREYERLKFHSKTAWGNRLRHIVK